MIIGIYAFPIFGKKIRINKIPNYNEYDWINIGAKPGNIVRLEHFVKLDNLNQTRALGSQEIAMQGWNYLNESQVGYIFDSIQSANQESGKLRKIKYNYLKSK